MSEIDNNPFEAAASEAAQNSNEQNNSSYSMFNEPIHVESDDDGDIPLSQDFFSPSSFTNEDNNGGQGQENNQGSENNNQGQENNQEDLVFDDPLITKENESAENKSDDDLKAALEKRGFTVTKEQIADPNAQKMQEVQRLNGVIADAQNFLALAPEVIVKEKLRAELTRNYQGLNKQHLINSEEFEIELDSEFEKYDQNSALLNLYATNVKREVESVIADSKGKANSIQKEVETENNKVLAEKRTQLQGGINAIHKAGIFGIKPTPEESKEIYDSIISGEFTKEVNSNPNLVAEFATFKKFREQIVSKFGGPTYGEGVKEAAEAINGGPLKTETSLTAVVKNTANGVTGGGEQINRKKAWGNQVVQPVAKEQKNDGVVAGASREYL